MTLKSEIAGLDRILRGEHWRDNLSGLWWRKETETALLRKHSAEVALWRAKDDIIKLKEVKTLADLKRYNEESTRRTIDASCVAALRSLKDRRIREIGFSSPSDLFTNNWGVLLSHFIQVPGGEAVGYTMVDTANSARTNSTSYGKVYGGGNYMQFWNNSSCGFQFQLGSGSTAAQRSNYNIQTAFATAPESAKFQIGQSASASGTITLGAVISAGGSGTVNELCMFVTVYWHSTSPATFLVARDIVTAVPFVAGNPLCASYSITL